MLDKASTAKLDLVLAVAHGQRWVLTDRAYAVLKRSCLSLDSPGIDLCGEITRIQTAFRVPYRLSVTNDYLGRFIIMGPTQQIGTLADLDELLSQLPVGSTFRWDPMSKPLAPQEQLMRDQVRGLLAEHKMTLVN